MRRGGAVASEKGVTMATKTKLAVVVVKRGPALAIQADDVLLIRRLREQKDALEQQVKDLTLKLKPLEDAVIAALDAGVPLGPKCPPCAVKVDERRVPRWKEIACGLAKRFLGVAVEVYEAQVLSETAAKIYRRLVINGDR